MNPHLTHLLDVLNDCRARHPGGANKLERGQLIDALRLISAPYSLEAVAQYCWRFISLVEARPAILPPELGKIDSPLAILREIAAAGADDPYFGQSHYPEDSPAPLQPFTGDGPLCDVLMLQARRTADQPQFARITEWFVWLCLRYHHKTLSAATYARYLDGEGSPDNRLNREDAGGPISAAGCQIRKLADPDQQVARDALCNLGLELSEEHGRYLARLAQRVHRVPKIGAHEVKSWSRGNQLSEEAARSQLEHMRNGVHGAIRHVLRLVWRWTEESGGGVARGRMRDAHRHYSRPRVHRYGHVREEIRVDDEDEEDAAGSIDVYVSGPPGAPGPRFPPDAWIDEGEDPDEPDGDALYHIHIGGAGEDAIASYYAAKGKRYADEYENALLTWSKKRLSRDALAALTASLRLTGSETPEVRAAKLIVLISLMTGRTLGEAKKARIDLATGGAGSRDAEVALSMPQCALYVQAAAPELSRSKKRRKRRLTHEIGQRLAIELPPIASELLGNAKWLGDRQLNLARYAHAAKTWLAGLPGQFAIKPGSLREALLFPLLEQTGGDLGLVKVITNRNSLNFTNIIHYAAYPADCASEHWAKALTRLLGTEIRPRPPPVGDPTQLPYVGTPDAMDKDALRSELDRLRERLRGCLGSSQPDGSAMSAVRAHNLLTLYTLLWLNLATAGRARVSPAPIAIIGDVALVSDKHRSDGSAERLVPLTAGVLAQLRAYFAYVWHLALRIPELRPIADAFSTGVIQFQFLKADGKVIGYRPKWLYEQEQLIPMPGNWARKLARQELTGIGGRLLDAGLGHWVAGRHPYRVTSNFAFCRFREHWLAGEERLERELGFEVIAHPQIAGAPIEWPVAGSLKPLRRPDPTKDNKHADSESEPCFDFEAECRRVDEDLYEGICEASEKAPKVVAALITEMARRRRGSKEEIREFVRACCAAAREVWRVPIFADAPRYQFQHDWLIDLEALFNLGYFTDRILPAFHAELEHPPAAPDPACADSIDLGRFVMLCIWRQGLVTWPVLDAFLKSYCTGGILATGQLRYVPSLVRCRRNGAVMGRINYLEPYCQAYMVVEYARIKAVLVPLLQLNPQQRRARVQSALGHYLRSLGQVDVGNLLTITLSAAQQYHLIHGSPVLAAYASAEFETHDLPDGEIRHLAGYEARSAQRSLLDLTDSFEQTMREERVPLPSSELKPDQDIVRKIARRKSPRVTMMRQEIEKLKPQSPLPRLLQAFAIWYLSHEAKKHGGQVNPAEKRQFQHVVEIVGYALVGFGKGAGAELVIDEAFLVNVEEQFRDMHADIDTSAPFQMFRRFLRQRVGRSAVEKAGFMVGEIEPPAPRGVLAKIVKTACLRAVADSIGRIDQSGIGNRDVRTVAGRHFDCVALFGLRRTEAEHIREMDLQGDLIRVQPYGAHTLKTSWSERVLPTGLTGFADLGWIRNVNDGAEHQLLARGIPHKVNGHNFYDAVNKLVQRKASDPGVHLHTVRHTAASRLLLSALSESVDYDKVTPQFPWLAEFLSSPAEMEVLFGGEGQSGHGLQAIAAMMGHSHPLTTLRHYIHTTGIAFYAHLCGRPIPSLIRAFEFRLGSSRTMQRRIQAWRVATKGMEPEAAQAFVHRNVLAEAETLCPDAVNVEEGTRTEVPDDGTNDPHVSEQLGYDPQAISYERLARVEAVLRGESPNDIGLDVARVEKALATIYAIRTGKRGDDNKRHPHVEMDFRWLPKQPAAKSPTLAAAALCVWIEQLRTRDAGLLDWLLDRWLHDSEKEFGRIRIGVDEDPRWQQLPSTPAVTLVKERKVFKRSPGSGRRDRVQRWRRIRCHDPTGSIIRRDVLAVRWVMTWTFALRSVGD